MVHIYWKDWGCIARKSGGHAAGITYEFHVCVFIGLGTRTMYTQTDTHKDSEITGWYHKFGTNELCARRKLCATGVVFCGWWCLFVCGNGKKLCRAAGVNCNVGVCAVLEVYLRENFALRQGYDCNTCWARNNCTGGQPSLYMLLGYAVRCGCGAATTSRDGALKCRPPSPPPLLRSMRTSRPPSALMHNVQTKHTNTHKYSFINIHSYVHAIVQPHRVAWMYVYSNIH